MCVPNSSTNMWCLPGTADHMYIVYISITLALYYKPGYDSTGE